MIALSLARHWKLIGTALIVAILVGVIAYRGHRIHVIEKALAVLAEQANTVVIRLRDASGNQDVTWETAPGQIVALGESNRALKSSVEAQNMAIDQMAADAVRMKAKAAELQVIADKAKAQRASALRKLSDMAITPGTRSDCLALLREAEDALDLVRGAGV